MRHAAHYDSIAVPDGNLRYTIDVLRRSTSFYHSYTTSNGTAIMQFHLKLGINEENGIMNHLFMEYPEHGLSLFLDEARDM